MNKNFKPTDQLGDIVAVFPGASILFRERGIDFCCGGNRPLTQAVQELSINVDEVIEELNKRFKEFQQRKDEFVDWAKESPTKLIHYIIETHHSYLNRELPRVSELVVKILNVHGDNRPELFKVHQLFSKLKTELEAHLVKEEKLIFPRIEQYEKNKTEQGRKEVLELIRELEDEHIGAGDLIKELQKVTNHYTAPEDGCTTYELAYKKLSELEANTFEHIHLENNILFKNL